MKKLLTYTIAISLILTALPVQVFAQEEKATQDNQEVTREKESDPQNQAIDGPQSEEQVDEKGDENWKDEEVKIPVRLRKKKTA